MTDEQNVDVREDHDEEYADAYGFWIFAFGVIGAVVGYNIGAEAGFGFWPNVGLGVLGLLVLAIVAYRFRRMIAVVGAIAIVIAVVAAVIEGIRSA
ncbi:MAG: hypothetical protein QNI96_07850 [Woeseiaceae bacterium]|nr:hypothetical protein [Woeseiaceae bacterium]